MRFEHNGRVFFIEFERNYKQIAQYDEDGKLTKTIRSKYPYTTVRILELVDGKLVKFRDAVVGAWHKERQFTLEAGRLGALREVTKSLSKDMKPKVWAAYQERAKHGN